MTNGELLSKAEDYIAEYVTDLKEMQCGGTLGRINADIERDFICELAGMQRLMSYLYKVTEEEDL